MAVQRTSPPSPPPRTIPGRICYLCGSGAALVLATCECCSDTWLVCDCCGVGLVRLASGS